MDSKINHFALYYCPKTSGIEEVLLTLTTRFANLFVARVAGAGATSDSISTGVITVSLWRIRRGTLINIYNTTV